VEAVKRLTTAYLKLLFPNVRSAKDVDEHLFMQYCLRPAIKMRGIIQKQLEILDPDEYRKPAKQMPQFSLRETSDEEV
jgi:ATP-dependent Lon protease